MDVIKKDFIVLDADVSTSDACIDLAAEFFMEKDYVTDGYAEATKAREKIYPTGLQTASMAIAIPHTDTQHANYSAVGCIIPKEPVEFIAMATEDTVLQCDIIFPIIVSELKEQVNMLKELMVLFNDSEALLKIKNAETTEEVMAVLGKLNNKLKSVKEVQ